MNSDTIIKSVTAVTKKWTKQRKAEEREASRRANRSDIWTASRATIKSAAYQVMEEAYLKASSNGTLPTSARQIYYAARRQILDITGKDKLDSQYFCQTLLPDYMAGHSVETADWDVTYDARGHFKESHTDTIVPLGTLEVRTYLEDVHKHSVTALVNKDFHRSNKFSTCGPRHRFGAVMFIEKEGFLPLFEAAKLAERYDIAIMSTKGMPVVACRYLADTLCGEHGIPLLVLHDFDKAGFSILGTLQDVEHDYQYDDYGDSRGAKRYEYQHDIEVIDLGLRLEDVEEYGLESEVVTYRSDPSDNLQENGATPEEVKFLYEDSWSDSGHRVELNAFTSGDFIEWIEAKLTKHGIKKVVPDADTLTTAYHRATQIALVHEQLDKIVEGARKQAEDTKPPKTLARAVRKRLKEDPSLSWDQAVAELAIANCKKTKGSQHAEAS